MAAPVLLMLWVIGRIRAQLDVGTDPECAIAADGARVGRRLGRCVCGLPCGHRTFAAAKLVALPDV